MSVTAVHYGCVDIDVRQMSHRGISTTTSDITGMVVVVQNRFAATYELSRLNTFCLISIKLEDQNVAKMLSSVMIIMLSYNQ